MIHTIIQKAAVLLALALPVEFANAQKPDSLPEIEFTDNLVNKYSGKPVNIFSVKSLSVPGALMVYGFASLQMKGLKNINLEVKEEINENNPLFKTRVDDYLQFAPAATVFLLEAGGIKGKHKLKDKVVIYGMGLAISAAVVFSLKRITHQVRPDGSKLNSFPSGHTANAFMGATFLHQEYGFRSSWYTYAGYTTATATGILRMYNNKHWLADVLTGAGIGIVSTKLSYWIFSKVEQKRSKRNSKKSSILF